MISGYPEMSDNVFVLCYVAKLDTIRRSNNSPKFYASQPCITGFERRGIAVKDFLDSLARDVAGPSTHQVTMSQNASQYLGELAQLQAQVSLLTEENRSLKVEIEQLRQMLQMISSFASEQSYSVTPQAGSSRVAPVSAVYGDPQAEQMLSWNVQMQSSEQAQRQSYDLTDKSQDIASSPYRFYEISRCN